MLQRGAQPRGAQATCQAEPMRALGGREVPGARLPGSGEPPKLRGDGQAWGRGSSRDTLFSGVAEWYHLPDEAVGLSQQLLQGVVVVAHPRRRCSCCGPAACSTLLLPCGQAQKKAV